MSNLIDVLENKYLKSFNITLHHNELYSLSLGIQKKDGVETLVNIWQNDKIIVINAIQIIQCTPFKVIIPNPSGDTDTHNDYGSLL